MTIAAVVQRTERQAFLLEDSGENPTLPHQLILKKVPKRVAKIAYKNWHYLGMNGFLSSINYGVYDYQAVFSGAISFGIPNAKNIR